jgi:hypothetical protein
MVYSSGVVLRSMSYGTPIIASNIDAFVEILENGKTALLFRSEDINDLNLQLSFAALNDHHMIKFAAASKYKIETIYSLNNLGSELSHVYKHVLSTRS